MSKFNYQVVVFLPEPHLGVASPLLLDCSGTLSDSLSVTSTRERTRRPFLSLLSCLEAYVTRVCRWCASLQVLLS